MGTLLILIILALGLFMGSKLLKNFTGGTKSIINSQKKAHHKNTTLPSIKIGNTDSLINAKPCEISLNNIKGIALEIKDNEDNLNSLIENIAFQIISKIGMSKVKITLIDPKKLGGSFRNLRKLDTKIIGNLVYSEEDIRTSISNIFNQSFNIINECLIHYNSLEEYNAKSGTVQPYRFLFIANFPIGFKDSIDKLNTILENSAETGTFVFVTYDKSVNLGSYQGSVQNILNHLTYMEIAKEPKNNLFKISNGIYKEKVFKLDNNDILREGLTLKYNRLLQTNNQTNNYNNQDGLRIPIGKVAGQTHYFTIGYGTENFHGIIGGQSGKGKTVLLNNIIARGIENHSVDELSFILIDCAGVGFQEYQNSNHIHNLISSSNVDVCVEGIKSLEEELLRREALFREFKVQELKDFNKIADFKLPRLICLIDEFHVLYSGSSRTSNYVDSILVEKVIKIGRKFGVHLLVSTQSLGSGVRKSILDNIPLRIALGMTEDQSISFLGFKNDSATNLERGVAIYNNQNGNIRANKTVRIDFIDYNDIERIIQSS